MPDIDEGALNELSDVLKLTDPGSGKVLFDPSITRGLDYYDGVVFEIDAPSLDAEKQICGGGAYSLSEVFGGDVEGIGFGLGFDRILVALGNKDPGVDRLKTFYLMPLGENAKTRIAGIANAVRMAGYRCVLETSDRTFKKALSSALQSGADYLMILGDDEIEKGTITIKNLATKEQTQIELVDVGSLDLNDL